MRLTRHRRKCTKKRVDKRTKMRGWILGKSSETFRRTFPFVGDIIPNEVFHLLESCGIFEQRCVDK